MVVNHMLSMAKARPTPGPSPTSGEGRKITLFSGSPSLPVGEGVSFRFAKGGMGLFFQHAIDQHILRAIRNYIPIAPK